MSNELQLRPMTEADLDAVVEMERSAFSHPWSRQLYSDALKSYDCWMLFKGEQHVGHGVIQVILDEASLLNIAIDPKHQGQGLGLYLLEALMRRAMELKASECYLELRESNHSAYRLYERYGFNEVGRRRAYYPAASGREDALVMACTLLD